MPAKRPRKDELVQELARTRDRIAALESSNSELRRTEQELRREIESNASLLRHAAPTSPRGTTTAGEGWPTIQWDKNRLESILNSLADGVYICNSDYEIEYANVALIAQFGPVDGRKCFAYFRDRKTPCPTCTVPRVLSGEIIRWEWYSPKTGKTYDVLETPVLDPVGGTSRIRIVRDISAHRATEEELQKGQALLEAVLREMPAAVIVVDAATGDIVLANEGAEGMEEILSPQPGGRTGERLFAFHPDGVPYTPQELPMARALHQGRTSTKEEVLVRRADGSLLTLLVSTALVHNREAKVVAVAGMCQDISERRLMEDGLREAREELEDRVARRTMELRRVNEVLSENEALLLRIFDTTHMLIAFLDPEFNFVRVNRAYAEADELPVDFFPGKNHFELYPNKENEAIFRTTLETGIPHFAYARPFTYALNPERGVTHWDWSLLPVRDADGEVEGLLLCLINVTERIRAEERVHQYQRQLRELASELFLAEEGERRRIAVQLHDGIGQTLALAKIRLGALRESLADHKLCHEIDSIREDIDSTIQHTRSLVFDLSPPILYELGLEAALERLTEKVQEEHGIALEYHDDGNPKPLAHEVLVALYQSTRELLINIVKHAHARSARLSISRKGSQVHVCLQDDGTGFDISEAGLHGAGSGGFGLFSIREQMDLLGGHLDLRSEPSKGTVATLVAPLEA